VGRLKLVEAKSLLRHFCISIMDTKDFGLECKTPPLGRAFADIVDNQFHPKGVIFGHFLESGGEGAAISGWSTEGHGNHFGGTLLLTRDNGKWKPIWYKSGLITRFCEKAKRADGRELLVCEFEDGGMGHRYHTLYGVDLRRPLAKIALADADSFESNFCNAQRQIMGAVTWGIDHRSFSVVIRTPEWYRLPEVSCGPHPPKRPRASARLEFDVTDDGLRPRRSATKTEQVCSSTLNRVSDHLQPLSAPSI
jgi:hypothetical protein